MSNPASILAYPDVKTAFDRVLATPRGIKVSFTTKAQAVRFVARCNYYRMLDRKENLKIYAEMTSHSLYGRSVFDHLEVALRGTDVHIKAVVLEEGRIEEL